MARVALSCVVALMCWVLPAAAVLAQFKIDSGFRNSTEPGWAITGTDNPGNDDSGILTGGYGPISDGKNTNDPNGEGWLRVTTSGINQVGRTLYNSGSFPSSLGVTIEFEYVSWGGNGADGITVFLYDATSSMANARNGGGLGYCEGEGGYLGIGLDEYGNFSSNLPQSQTGGCEGTGPRFAPDSIVIRGPVTASPRNPYVAGAVIPGGLDVPGAASRPASQFVRGVLIPNGSGGYRVTVSRGASVNGQTVVLNRENFPYVAPPNLRIGIGGSTGASRNIHEVRNLTVSAPADIQVTKSTNSQRVLRGQRVAYTLQVRNKDINPVDAGDQSPAIDADNVPDIIDTLPDQLQNATWTCTATPGSSCPAANGSGDLNVTGGYRLAPGGSLTFTIEAEVSATAACDAQVRNTAVARFTGDDGFSDIFPDDNGASADFTVACPRVTIRKTSVNGVGTFGFSGSNGITEHAITTTTADTPVDGAVQMLAAAGTATTITEAAPGDGFALDQIECTGLGAGGAAAVDLPARTVMLDEAATLTEGPIVCTFRNVRQVADLSVTKSNGGGDPVAGQETTYTIVVSNRGPSTAVGATVRDPATPGLTCTQPAACSGEACPGATIPVQTLQGMPGAVLGALPSGASVTLTLTCHVD